MTSVPGKSCQSFPVERRLAFPRFFVACDQGHRRRQSAIGHRDAGIRASRQCRGDARHNFIRHRSAVQGFNLLRGAGKDRRVAAFEPHDVATSPGVGEHLFDNLRLLPDSTLAVLSHTDFLSTRRMLEQLAVAQSIKQHNVGAGQQLLATQRQ